MSYRDLKEIWSTLSPVKVDKNFKKVVYKFKQQFWTKNAEHVGFFTGHYFGVHRPKWMQGDSEYWLDDVLMVDEDEISEAIYALPTINKDYKVSSNILSIGMLWLMYLVQQSNQLNQKEKDDLKVTLMEILIARYLTSIMDRYFSRAPTSVEIAEETFKRLSKRFDLKEAGSWGNFVRKRAEGLTLGENTQASKYGRQEVFETFEDNLVVQKLNTTKTRLNNTIVEINSVFRQVLEDKATIERTSSIKNGESGAYISDLTVGGGVYTAYSDRIFLDKRSFIKEELLAVIEKSIPTINSKVFRETLEWMLNNQYDKKWHRDINDVRTRILLYGVSVMQEEGLSTLDMVTVGQRLRQNFMSGKTMDPELVWCRKTVDKILVHIHPRLKGKLISMERTALLIYFAIRPLAMSYYNNN